MIRVDAGPRLVRTARKLGPEISKNYRNSRGKISL